MIVARAAYLVYHSLPAQRISRMQDWQQSGGNWRQQHREEIANLKKIGIDHAGFAARAAASRS